MCFINSQHIEQTRRTRLFASLDIFALLCVSYWSDRLTSLLEILAAFEDKQFKSHSRARQHKFQLYFGYSHALFCLLQLVLLFPLGCFTVSSLQGMILSQDYLVAVSGTHGDSHVRPLELEIVNLKRQIQANKQSISQQKYQANDGIENFRPSDVSALIIITRRH